MYYFRNDFFAHFEISLGICVFFVILLQLFVLSLAASFQSFVLSFTTFLLSPTVLNSLFLFFLSSSLSVWGLPWLDSTLGGGTVQERVIGSGRPFGPTTNTRQTMPTGPCSGRGSSQAMGRAGEGELIGRKVSDLMVAIIGVSAELLLWVRRWNLSNGKRTIQ